MSCHAVLGPQGVPNALQQARLWPRKPNIRLWDVPDVGCVPVRHAEDMGFPLPVSHEAVEGLGVRVLPVAASRGLPLAGGMKQPPSRTGRGKGTVALTVLAGTIHQQGEVPRGIVRAERTEYRPSVPLPTPKPPGFSLVCGCVLVTRGGRGQPRPVGEHGVHDAPVDVPGVLRVSVQQGGVLRVLLSVSCGS